MDARRHCRSSGHHYRNRTRVADTPRIHHERDLILILDGCSSYLKLDAIYLLHMSRRRLAASLLQQLFDAFLQLLVFLYHRFDPAREMLRLRLQQPGGFGQPLLQLNSVAIRGRASQRLDPAHAGGRPRLVREAEQGNLASRRDVGAAAQLERHTRHVHHADDVAVLHAEQRHRTGGDRVLVRHLSSLDRQVFPDVGIDLGLDGGKLIAFDRAMMTEIETQPLGRDHRPGLSDMGAQNLPQRGVHQVRGGMIALDIAAARFVDLRDGQRRLERLTERADHGVLAVDLFDALDGQLPTVAFHDTGVTYLATGLGVERVLLENDLELITCLPERDGLGFGFGRFVTDPFLLAFRFQLDPLAASAPPFAALRRRLSRRPAAPPLLSERALKSLDVYRMPVLGRDHLREVERETVRVIELERILARNDRLVPQLFHAPEPAFDRLEETFFLGAGDALDVLFFGDELGIDVAHRRPHGVRQGGERRLAAAEEPGVADGAAQNPA